MKTNTRTKSIYTHEGAKAKAIGPEAQLRRSVMSCLLWEKDFYEDGESVAERVTKLIPTVAPEVVANMAIEAREKMKLRHMPLLLVREMARYPEHKKLVSKTLSRVIQRPDELSEFVSLYWKEGKKPLSAQVKRGLANAFLKFNEYNLAKYNQDRAVKLRDVLFLCHVKPKDKEQEALFKKLVDGTLATPDTWEVSLSTGKDKKETWERLIAEKKLGALATLRNLRNIQQVHVDQKIIKQAILSMNTERVLPFRFIAASKFAPDFEPDLETTMFKCLEDQKKLQGPTCLMVDVSGSMDTPISQKSDLQRVDAAIGLAMLLREVCADVQIHTFSNKLIKVPPRRGFALRDLILSSQPHSGTELGGALKSIAANGAYERMIVITDEQSSDAIPDPPWAKSYVINVANNKNGVGYGKWLHIDGWSEAIVDYIRNMEE